MKLIHDVQKQYSISKRKSLPSCNEFPSGCQEGIFRVPCAIRTQDSPWRHPALGRPHRNFESNGWRIYGVKTTILAEELTAWNPKANQIFMVGNQLDDSKPLLGKWLEITKHPFKSGCLGFQECITLWDTDIYRHEWLCQACLYLAWTRTPGKTWTEGNNLNGPVDNKYVYCKEIVL